MLLAVCRREGALSSSPHPQLLSIYNYTCRSFPLRHRPIRASLHKNTFSKNIKLFFQNRDLTPSASLRTGRLAPAMLGVVLGASRLRFLSWDLAALSQESPRFLCCLLDRQSKLAIKQHVQDLIKRPQ